MCNRLISVIIPLYNKERHVARAIDSIYAQTYKNFEVIVIDDGSSDNSADVVIAMKMDNLSLIRQENRGVSAARNSGIRRSNGDIIAFLDADDEWRVDFLETIIQLMDRYDDAGLYATSYAICGDDGIVTERNLTGIPPSPWHGLIDNYFKVILYSLPISSSCVAIPKKVFVDVGMFAEGEPRAEDQEMWFRVALKYKIAFCNTPCATYYHNADNRVCKTMIEREPKFFFDTLQHAADMSNNPENSYLISEFLAKNKLHFARKFMEGNRFSDAIEMINNCKTQMFTRDKQILLAKCHVSLRWIFRVFNMLR